MFINHSRDQSYNWMETGWKILITFLSELKLLLIYLHVRTLEKVR